METSNIQPTEIPDWERGLTFEKVWLSIKELRKSQKENADRLDKRMEKWAKTRDNQLDRLEKQLGKLGNRIGEMVEHLASPNLHEKFRAFGFNFAEYSRDKVMRSKDHFVAEVDVFLENSDKVMIVEIKSKPSIQDIKEHIERMDKIRAYVDNKGDKRAYYSAIGGMVFNVNERAFALKSGFYVIEPSGNTFDIIAPEGEYQPREW